MSESDEVAVYDVVVVGYGPAGMVLAALLGQAGWRVAVVERHAGLYNLPRAATFDDEIMRTFQKLGCADEIARGTIVQTTYEWCNAAGERLIEHSFDERGRSGWAEWYMMYQPHLEDVLDAKCRALDGVDLFQGWAVDRFQQLADGVLVQATRADERGHPEPSGKRRSWRGRYLAACDGGNSFVRSTLAIELDDYGFQEPWLVCDFRMRRPLDLPAARQLCDPAQPTAIIQIGPNHRRFSFMLNSDDRPEDATRPEAVWGRVSRWVSEDDVELIRVAYYTFRSLIAKRWAAGRVFLAGDAAHQMPPFLGQGMCSGIRDAHNLAWKLDLVLDGCACASLLDTYGNEREPHVRAITEQGIQLGRIQTLRDPDAAQARDERWLALRAEREAPDRLEFPGLVAGLIADPVSSSGAGERFPQGIVEQDGRRSRFDDIVGQGFALIAREPGLIDALDRRELEWWTSIGGHVVALGSLSGQSKSGLVSDVEGVYAKWLHAHRAAAVVVRPDWYVYGSAPEAESLVSLLEELRERLGCPSAVGPREAHAKGSAAKLVE